MLRRSVPLAFGATLVFCGPALAQDVCGLGAGSASWIAGDPAASDISGAEAPLDATAEVLAGQPAVTMFTVTEATAVRVEATPIGDGDTLIQLYDEAGQLLLEDDDGGEGVSSQAMANLDAGGYCLLTTNYENGAMTAGVRVGLAAHEPLTQGVGSASSEEICTPETEALPLAISSAGDIEAPGLTVSASVTEAPFYRFTLTEPTAITFKAENEGADPVIALFDGAGREIAQNDDFDGLNSQIDMSSPMAPGDYCLAMRAIDDENAPIVLTVTAFDPEAAARALYASGEASPPLDGAYPVEDLGLLETTLTKDMMAADDMAWHRFELAESSMVLIDGIGAGSVDPTLSLFDTLGRKIATDDDGGDETDSRIAARLQPGSYMVGIGRIDDDGFGILRITMERFVPAQ